MSDFLGIKEDGTFRFHIPLELKKGRDDKIWIQGIASKGTPDLVGDVVVQKGMDLGYLLKRGFFNDNHDKQTGAKVGIPTEARHTSGGLFVKGYMLDTPRAQEIVNLAEALKKSGGDRQMGFSVEGKILRRDGKIVERSWVKDIAITCEPMHPDTYMDIVKSISEEIEQNGTIEDFGEDVTLETIHKSLLNIESLLEKALMAGNERETASPLMREDVEKDLKYQDVPEEKDEDKEDLEKDEDKKKKR
ncbi:MAG: hypothetical protein JW836_11235, partial [Deltaproteobacteria bacterium]|nr:hypothetical protein [Deltaproteobacteria bacterium]